MTDLNPKVDAYIAKSDDWQDVLVALREIVLACGLSEDFKWGKPCYTCEGGNLIAIARLKERCWIMFFKGALLKDPAQILEKAGENSRSMRIVPFTRAADVTANADLLRAYVLEAVAAQKAGLKVDFKDSKNLVFADELVDAFDKDPDLKAAFDALTPGRQRGYNLFFNGAKQSKTRHSRIAKCTADILIGKGLNDR